MQNVSPNVSTFFLDLWDDLGTLLIIRFNLHRHKVLNHLSVDLTPPSSLCLPSWRPAPRALELGGSPSLGSSLWPPSGGAGCSAAACSFSPPAPPHLHSDLETPCLLLPRRGSLQEGLWHLNTDWTKTLEAIEKSLFVNITFFILSFKNDFYNQTAVNRFSQLVFVPGKVSGPRWSCWPSLGWQRGSRSGPAGLDDPGCTSCDSICSNNNTRTWSRSL